MIKHNFPYESFIGGWDIPENVCDDLITYFNNHKDQHKAGMVIKDNKHIEDVDFKESTDYIIKPFGSLEPIETYEMYLHKILEEYKKLYPCLEDIENIDFYEDYNMQYYPIGGGIKKWHYERMNKLSSNRVLVFMTYLNDVEDGGTEFLHQKINTKAKKGMTLIWPADWTHTHKGQVSQTSEKYIVTGWIGFNEVPVMGGI